MTIGGSSGGGEGGGGGGGGATDNTGSVYFDGDGDCLTVADNTDFEFGSGNFTLEAFINYSGNPGTGSDTYVIASKWDNQSAPNDKGFILRISDDGGGDNLQWYYTTDGSNNQVTTGSTVLSPNAWYHIAFVRNGSTGTFYIDGVADSTTVSFGSDSIRDTGNAFRIGANLDSGSVDQEFSGFISNARVVKGTAVYSGNRFTPPAAPLTNVTNTKLLCCQSITSPTVAAVAPGSITAHGDVSLSTAYPFGAGSVLFDGNDYLSLAASNDFDFGSGDFTIEGFFYKTTTTTLQTLLCSSRYYTSGNNGNWILRITDANNIAFASYDGQSNEEYTNFSASTSVNTWYHFALVREGTGTNQTKFYLNGSLAGSMTVSKSLSDAGTNGLRIGEESPNGPGNNFMNGYLSNIRIIKGTALYTSNFTVPTSPLTAVTNTKLLCCQSEGPVTSAVVSPGTITANGDPEASTSNPFSIFNGLLTRFDLTGSSLNPSTDDFSSSLLESDGSFGGSGQTQYYEIDSRTTAANRLAWEFDFSSVSSYDHFAIQFEYYWDAGDNFKTTFAWQNNGSWSGNLTSFIRTDNGTPLYSGRWMGKNSTTASDTWGQTSSSWISVVGYHNINNNTGYLKFNGTKRIEGNTNADSTYTYYTSADTLSFAQFVDNANSDNGIRMRVGVIQISCWNGQESDMPAFNGRFT